MNKKTLLLIGAGALIFFLFSNNNIATGNKKDEEEQLGNIEEKATIPQGNSKQEQKENEQMQVLKPTTKKVSTLTKRDPGIYIGDVSREEANSTVISEVLPGGYHKEYYNMIYDAGAGGYRHYDSYSKEGRIIEATIRNAPKVERNGKEIQMHPVKTSEGKTIMVDDRTYKLIKEGKLKY